MYADTQDNRKLSAITPTNPLSRQWELGPPIDSPIHQFPIFRHFL